MHRKILVHPHGDRFHERKMLEYDPIAPGDLGGWSALSGLGFHLGCLSFWKRPSWADAPYRCKRVARDGLGQNGCAARVVRFRETYSICMRLNEMDLTFAVPL